ncbi:MAG: NAD(+) synthase [Oligoflexia bacterium]|nr:NAD(+) synthase [Oligoflexia bacterium]
MEKSTKNINVKNINVNIHQTHHTVADFFNIKNYLIDYFKSIKATIKTTKEEKEGREDRENREDHSNVYNLHLFPELFLTGYPLQDLCLQRSFILSYQKLISEINEWSKTTINTSNTGSNLNQQSTLMLLGGLQYTLDNDNWPYEIKNVIYKLVPGEELTVVYSKILLPNYDIFDEKKYFTPGETPTILEWNGKNLALMICEDMWPSSAHKIDPLSEIEKQIKKSNINLDLIINLSAGPYHINKNWIRIKQAQNISKRFKAPFAYVNRVGAEDEILFDGQSFLINEDKFIIKANAFKAQTLTINLHETNTHYPSKNVNTNTNTNIKAIENKIEIEIEEIKIKENIWAQLYSPEIIPSSSSSSSKNSKLPTLPLWSEGECQEAIDALIFGLHEYAKKSKFNNFLVALSGGLDSSLVLALTYLCIKKEQGQKLEAIFMPSKYSATLSYELSKTLCNNLNIPFHYLPIKFLHSSCQNAIFETFKSPLQGLADENIQSRLRGMLLYARSNQSNALVINTSNKSELAVGYSTMYGDSVGGISLLGDLYKTEIYQLANYINRAYNNLIPEGIISRPPSAELRENQTDEMSLPPYERLDAILEGILSYHITASELVKLGFSKDEVLKTFKLYYNSEYKRRQFAPIIKIKSKSFGFGYRIPINKNNDFYSI